MPSSWIDIRPVGDNGLADVRVRWPNGAVISLIPNISEKADTVELALLTESGAIWGSTVWPNLPVGEVLLKALVLSFTATGAASAYDVLVGDPVLKPYQQQWPG